MMEGNRIPKIEAAAHDVLLRGIGPPQRVMKVAFVSVLPSPYQRDLFAALAARSDVTPRVFYMERAAPDSPWPERPLAPYESYLPGFWFSLGHARVHLNWRLPSPRDHEGDCARPDPR